MPWRHVPVRKREPRFPRRFRLSRCAALALVLVLSLTHAAAGSGLSDIGTHWARQAIRQMMDYGVVSGYPDGLFHPDAALDRAAFTKMIVAATGVPLQPRAAVPFIDMPDHWCAVQGYLQAAIGAGIVVPSEYGVRWPGMESGPPTSGPRFDPGRPCSRLEICVMVVRALGLDATAAAGESSTHLDALFSDAALVPADLAGYVGLAVEEGIITGFADGTFRPTDPASRAQAAVMVKRMLVAMDRITALGPTDALEFFDVTVSVQDPGGNPVENAEVAVYSLDLGDQAAAGSITGPDGTCVCRVPSGVCRFTATAACDRQVLHPQTLEHVRQRYPAGRTLCVFRQVRVKPGMRVDLRPAVSVPLALEDENGNLLAGTARLEAFIADRLHPVQLGYVTGGRIFLDLADASSSVQAIAMLADSARARGYYLMGEVHGGLAAASLSAENAGLVRFERQETPGALDATWRVHISHARVGSATLFLDRLAAEGRVYASPGAMVVGASCSVASGSSSAYYELTDFQVNVGPGREALVRMGGTWSCRVYTLADPEMVLIDVRDQFGNVLNYLRASGGFRLIDLEALGRNGAVASGEYAQGFPSGKPFFQLPQGSGPDPRPAGTFALSVDLRVFGLGEYRAAGAFGGPDTELAMETVNQGDFVFHLPSGNLLTAGGVDWGREYIADVIQFDSLWAGCFPEDHGPQPLDARLDFSEYDGHGGTTGFWVGPDVLQEPSHRRVWVTAHELAHAYALSGPVRYLDHDVMQREGIACYIGHLLEYSEPGLLRPDRVGAWAFRTPLAVTQVKDIDPDHPFSSDVLAYLLNYLHRVHGFDSVRNLLRLWSDGLATRLYGRGFSSHAVLCALMSEATGYDISPVYSQAFPLDRAELARAMELLREWR